MARTLASICTGIVVVAAAQAALAQPEYTIVDLGTVNAGDTFVQGLGISTGGTAFGRSIGSTARAFSWTSGDGIVGLGTIAGRNFYVANGANDAGLVVGNASTNLSGAGALPMLWTNGAAAQLPLVAGQTIGRANDVNTNGIVVGSIGSGSTEGAAYWSDGVVTQITTATQGGALMRTAFRVNNAGQVAGQGIDPGNAARNVAILYDVMANTAIEVPPLAGLNGALAFDVSESGYVVGSSMQNQGSGRPFRWNSKEGSIEIPLPAGTSQGSARAVNSDGWTVGNSSSAFSVPFLFDGTSTYRLQDLIPADSGWDLSMNTSSSALGISENGTIVGTGVRSGATRAYAMVLVPKKSCPCDWNASGGVDSQDFFDFLGGFFSNSADYNASGATDSQDLFDFLQCFFELPAGC